MEARKAEFDEKTRLTAQRQKPHNPLPVPDFKALHAAQEAELALRKDKITPVLPLPIELNTDGRAKEREKFDELMREKEKELERAIEERRKQKEAEEEKEVKEIRRRAVPKAHEVPQWYKEAPKKGKGKLDGVTE